MTFFQFDTLYPIESVTYFCISFFWIANWQNVRQVDNFKKTSIVNLICRPVFFAIRISKKDIFNWFSKTRKKIICMDDVKQYPWGPCEQNLCFSTFKCHLPAIVTKASRAIGILMPWIFFYFNQKQWFNKIVDWEKIEGRRTNTTIIHVKKST